MDAKVATPMTSSSPPDAIPTSTPTEPRARLDRLSPATARAYAADLRDLHDFSVRMRLPVSLDQVTERHLFAYLASLIKAGRSSSTVRRRLTAMRANVADNGHGLLTVSGLHAMEDHLQKSLGTQTTALIASDDAIVREGLAAVLSRQGVLTWTDRVSEAVAGDSEIWDYMIVWLPSRHGVDPFASVEWIATASANGVPIVTLHPDRLTVLARLRLAEAGARYAIPQSWLSERIEGLPQMLSTASLPVRFHLETPLALRQRLGLELSGQLQPLLDAAAHVDERVWRASRHEDAPRVDRSEIQRLRRIAKIHAGIPPPSGRYSTAVRSAPTAPDWREVRRVVRQALNFSDI